MMLYKKLLILTLCIIAFGKWNFYAQNYPDYIPFHKGDKWGFCDSSKAIRINPRYESADFFNHGHARVSLNNHWGFIDSVGNEHWLPDSVSFLSYNDEFIMVSNGKKNTLMDHDFNLLKFYVYDAVLEFDHGLAPVRIGERWGYIDKTGREVVPIFYGPGYHGKFVEGLTWQMMNGKSGYLDTTGKIAIPFEYELASPFINGYAQVRKNNKWIVINKHGKEFDSLNYDYTGPFYDGLSAVKMGNKTGFIDTLGKLVIP
ncbi:MAG: WG repeat-containing protein, partial [Bacteroidota bacterium]